MGGCEGTRYDDEIAPHFVLIPGISDSHPSSVRLTAVLLQHEHATVWVSHLEIKFNN